MTYHSLQIKEYDGFNQIFIENLPWTRYCARHKDIIPARFECHHFNRYYMFR